MSIGSRDARAPAAVNVVWRVRAWIQSFRLRFLPQGVMPVVLGSVVAWIKFGTFNWFYLTLVLVGSVCVQIGLTMLNDTLDFLYGTDCSNTTSKNPYSGGSGVLADGSLQPHEMLILVVLFYSTAALIGAFLTIQAGAAVFWFALLGLILSVFYSAKPLRLAYHGVGELAMFIGYGPTITLGAAYVQAGRFDLTAVLASIVPGLLMWSMILVNEIPDYEEDLHANKLNLTVRLGPDRARWLYIVSLCSVYGFIVLMAAVGLLPLWTLLSLASIPFAVRSFQVVHRFYLDPKPLAAANRAMVATYSSTMLLLCIGLLMSKIL